MDEAATKNLQRLLRQRLRRSNGRRDLISSVHEFVERVFACSRPLGKHAVLNDEPKIVRFELRDSVHGASRTQPSFNIRSAVASLRTTCSGVCFFLVAMLMSSLPAHDAGRKTLKTTWIN